MDRAPWRDRIRIDPEIHHAEPCIEGTRVPVRMIVGSLADGFSVEQVLEEYPSLKPRDVYSALSYASEVLRQESFLPLLARA